MSYFDVCRKLSKINLTIVGKDPYPQNATEIPFCKEKWEMFHKNISGFIILAAINKDFSISKQISLGINPKECFTKLAEEKGIVFLNGSYTYLNGDKFSRKKHGEYVKKAYSEVNHEILDKSSNILLCGMARKMLESIVPFFPDNFKCVPHPSLQGYNRSNCEGRRKWNRTWSEGALERYLK